MTQDETKQQLTTMKKIRDELRTELAALEAEAQQVRAARAQAVLEGKPAAGDARLAQITSRMADIHAALDALAPQIEGLADEWVNLEWSALAQRTRDYEANIPELAKKEAATFAAHRDAKAELEFARGRLFQIATEGQRNPARSAELKAALLA